MKRVFRALSLVILLAGLLSFSLAWEKRKRDIEPARSYVAVFFEAQTAPDGKMTISGWRTKYVKANGEFRTVMHGSDAAAAFSGSTNAFSGTSSPIYANTSEGVFAKASGSDGRKATSSSAPEDLEKMFHSHSLLKSSDQFVRMDKVAGLDVYVMRMENAENPGYWTEVSVSPLTGRSPLRVVTHQPDGTLFTLEAAKVEFREVPDNLNDDIMSLPDTGKLGDKPAPAKRPNSN
jgi:hypothetical protein